MKLPDQFIAQTLVSRIVATESAHGKGYVVYTNDYM